MAEKDRKPRIRFKGFADAWEQRKVGDVVEVQSGRDYKHLGSGSIPVYGTGGLMLYVDKALSYSSDAIGIGRKGTIDKPYVLRAPFWTVDTLFYAVPKAKNDLYFVYCLFQRIDWKSKDESTGVPSLSKQTINDSEVKVATEQEQRTIGAYFSKLDDLITLHQRKYDKLVDVKKSMLEKMFPQGDEKVPKIRFKGFSDAWEQRKLGEVGKARSGCGFPDTEQGGAEGIPFFKVSDMNSDGNENEMMLAKNYVTEEQIVAHRWNPISELPAIFFAKVGAAVMLNRKRLCRFPFLLDNNTMAYSLNNNYWDAGYAKALFETIDLTALVQVGALPSYNAGDVEAILVWLPTLEEQRVIGAYFKELDDLITLHQRKLEKLKNIKSALLEKMFV